MVKHLLGLMGVPATEMEHYIELARNIKAKKVKPILAQKTLAMLFEKSSTRTRVSFETGMTQMGGHAIFLDIKTSQLGRGESIADTARTLSRYVDGVMVRLNKHGDAEELAKHSTIPVINGLTDFEHPCQTLGDMLTVVEHKGKLNGLKVAFVGDCAFNMSNSTILGFGTLGADVVAVCPDKPEYKPSADFLAKARKQVKGKISVVHDPVEGVRNADVVHTDVWASMGQETEREKRLDDLRAFQLNAELLKHAKADHIVMHCLPAHRGEEITNDVIDGKHSVVWDQAENRLHIQKAIMAALMAGY